MIRRLGGLVICGCSLLVGCGVQPLVIWRDVVVAGDATVDDLQANHLNVNDATIGEVVIDGEGNVSVPGNLVVGGTVTAEEVVDLPPPPLPPPPPPPPPDDDDEPELLVATLLSDNGDDHFPVGADVKLIVYVSGGEAPYDYRCQWVDGDFSTLNNSPDSVFSFGKIINSPGAGVVTCQVISDDGQAVRVSFTIYLE